MRYTAVKGEDTMNTFEKAKTFIYRHARPLDLALWQFHFEKGSPDAVVRALSFYQNEDGGFGHGLEPDFLNPNSTPIATWQATQILREIGFTDKNHPMIVSILRYLESGADFSLTHRQWDNTVPTNNEYPHAIWWKDSDERQYRYNPTAALAGFILRYADPASTVYQLGRDIAQEAVTWFLQTAPFEDQHITACFLTLYEDLTETQADYIDLSAFRKKLNEQVGVNICRDTEKWKTSYVPKPSDFIMSQASPFYADNAETAEYECEHITENQLPDGSFPVPWQWWTDYKEFEISQNYWKAIITIKNMRYLQAFGKR